MKIDTIEYIKEMNFNNMKQDDIQFCYDSIEDQHIKGNGNLVTLEVNDKIVEVNAKHLLTQLEVKYNVKPKNCSILTLTDIKDMGLKNLEKLDKKNTMDLIKIYSEIHYKRLDVEKHYDFDYDRDLSIKSVITNQMATDLQLNAVEIDNYDSVIICDVLTTFENKISEMIQSRLNETKEFDKMSNDIDQYLDKIFYDNEIFQEYKEYELKFCNEKIYFVIHFSECEMIDNEIFFFDNHYNKEVTTNLTKLDISTEFKEVGVDVYNLVDKNLMYFLEVNETYNTGCYTVKCVNHGFGNVGGLLEDYCIV